MLYSHSVTSPLLGGVSGALEHLTGGQGKAASGHWPPVPKRPLSALCRGSVKRNDLACYSMR